MRFDAYTATIREAELSHVVHTLENLLEGIACKGRPMRRYATTVSIDVGNRSAAWVGLDSASGAVYVEGKGETSPDLARIIRTHFPDHSCPRADVCEDYDEPGAFEALQSVVRQHKGPRVKGGYVALPDELEDGRTWSAGVRGGVGYIRVYEAGKHPERVHLGRPHWAHPTP